MIKDMANITDKWQCVKCKATKTQIVETITLDNEKITIKPEDVPKIMCHCHIMRNLTEDQFSSENGLNDSGARDKNHYRLLDK